MIADAEERRLYYKALRESRREPPVLLPGTLAAFLEPMGWGEILALKPRRSAAWWRESVIDAEERGLLCWDVRRRTWGLTDLGRMHVRDVC